MAIHIVSPRVGVDMGTDAALFLLMKLPRHNPEMNISGISFD
jgi:hypothetical protein